MKYLFLFVLNMIQNNFLHGQIPCFQVEIDHGDSQIIPYCQVKVVNITVINIPPEGVSACTGEHFDVVVTCLNPKIEIVDPGDFISVPVQNGFKVEKNNLFVPANGSYTISFSFYADKNAPPDFNVDFFARESGAPLFHHLAHTQFLIENFIRLTGILSDLLNDPNSGLLSSAESCDPGKIRFYIIDGLFQVDVDYCLRGLTDLSDMIITPGSKIEIINDAHLRIYNLKMGTRNGTACQSEIGWVGFEVMSGSELTIDNSRIRDAHYGINAQVNTKITCSNSVFMDNYIGIYRVSGIGKANVTLAKCKFFENLGLAEMYSGEPSRIGTKPYAGIQALNTDISMTGGGPIQFIALHNFEGLNNGIIAVDCNLTLNDVSFKNIGKENLSGGINSYNGIRMRGIRSRSANITGCKFFDMQHCIRSINMDAMINQCHFGDLQENSIVGYGIIVENSRTKHTIKNCTLRVNQTGILLENNLYGGGENLIEGNLFKTDWWDDSRAIWAKNVKYPWIISTNTFEPKFGKFGILSEYSANFIIHNNVLKYPLNLGLHHHAVQLNTSDAMKLSCNAVLGGPVNSGLNLHGFDVALTPNSDFVCNSFITGQRQMVFLEQNMNSMVKGNTFGGGALYGIAVGDDQIKDAYIGEQPDPSQSLPDYGNRWSGAYSTFGAANFSLNDRIIRMSRFLVDQQENSEFLPTLPPGQLNLFFKDESKPEASFSCSSISNCKALDARFRTIGNDDTAYISIINGNLDFEYYQDEQSWTGKYILYKLLQEGSFIAEEGSDFESFILNNLNTELGILYNAQSVIQNSISSLQSEWDEIQSGILDLEAYQLELDALAQSWAEADSAGRVTIFQEMLIILSDMEAISSNLDALYEEINDDLSNRAFVATVELTNLSTSTSPAENLRLSLLLALKKIDNPQYVFSSPEIGQLQTIAETCDLEGGIGTGIARALLGAEYELYFERYENCQFSSPLIFGNGNRLVRPLDVSPVPAREEIIIKSASSTEYKRPFKIVNVLGKEVLNYVLPENTSSVKVSIHSLQNGVYYILDAGNKTEHAKFIKH